MMIFGVLEFHARWILIPDTTFGCGIQMAKNFTQLLAAFIEVETLIHYYGECPISIGNEKSHKNLKW